MGRLPRILGAAMGTAARRPLAVGLLVTVLALAGAALALRLSPTTASKTLVGSSSASYQATEREHQLFGEDAVYVLVRGAVSKLVLTSDLERLIALEGCLGGNVPKGATPVGGWSGPCGRLGKTKPAKVVFGPGTFINESVRQIGDQYNSQLAGIKADAQKQYNAAYQLARGKHYSVARAKALAQKAADLASYQALSQSVQLALKYGLLKAPQVNDPGFVSQLVFAGGKAAGTPKARFAYLFPNADSSLIQVRLKPGLSDAARKDAITQIRAATKVKELQLLNGGRFVVTGAPVVLSDLTTKITDAIVTLLIASILVMALVLAVVFRARRRLLPLAVALAAVAITFGALSAIGASLTMASVGVVPVLIGLAVDYAIQLQARIEERAGPRATRAEVVSAVGHVARTGAPAVAVAAAATAAGFLVLGVSPVPMVRGFGLLLVAGIFIALATAITLGTAALVGTVGKPSSLRLPGAVVAAGEIVASAGRGAGELLTDNPVARGVSGRGRTLRSAALGAAVRRPERVLAIGLAIAVVGWVADTQTKVESDVTKLVPQSLPALADLQALQKSTSVGGQIDVLVRSDKLTTPATLNWMSAYQLRLLKRFGYSDKRGCGKAELCPAFSLPDLFGGDDGKGKITSQAQVNELLDVVPPYFSQSVITHDRKTATMAFGIRLMPLDRQKQVLDIMRSELHPPKGVSAQLAGLPVLAADANAAVSSPWRRLLTLVLGLLAVGAVLLVAFRSWRRALTPLVPIALATGWSALVLFATRVPLNPMSVTLGALVIAISTEFSVLLAERYRTERRGGLDPAAALERTYRSTGAAVLASGVTAIAGFAVLTLSDIRMLRDFGAVTVIDLTVSLLGVLLVLPSALVLGERWRPADVRVRRPRVRLPRPSLPRRSEKPVA
ncbi:efflux RND transporter permease subunit [Baekduia sp.]|jgi:hydrophobe/amphiphile efflux-3 (HAE3) family protein|uniref:efflux RND transporter permease subunit n=1 Tax=Baekduia sp. TaxID=2600305 RepID=UPI002DFC2153|nr:MMPL family transporter [Baekduia sp.]